MKIKIPPINCVHKRTNHANTLKAHLPFGKTAPQEELDFAVKTKFPVTLHDLVPVLSFPLPSNRSHDHMDRGGCFLREISKQQRLKCKKQKWLKHLIGRRDFKSISYFWAVRYSRNSLTLARTSYFTILDCPGGGGCHPRFVCPLIVIELCK